MKRLSTHLAVCHDYARITAQPFDQDLDVLLAEFVLGLIPRESLLAIRLCRYCERSERLTKRRVRVERVRVVDSGVLLEVRSDSARRSL